MTVSRRWLASTRTPDGREMVLYERGGAFTLRVDGRELMTSRAHGSEEALARAACSGIDARAELRVLVGGLGMGYTLAAVLDALPAIATVVVAEILPAVIAWNRGVLGPLAGRPLNDLRVRAVAADVAHLLVPGVWDAILLDVDNGPEALTTAANDELYTLRGVERLAGALAPGGTLAVWSAEPAPRFEDILRAGGLEVEVRTVATPAGERSVEHQLFVCRKD